MIDKTAARVSQGSDKPPAAAADHYEAVYHAFRWHVPRRFNMAQVCCARWAAQPHASENTAICSYSTKEIGQADEAGGRLAPAGSGAIRHYSFAELQQAANRLSNWLKAQGVQRGDRVAIVMPQRFETAVAYIAVLQMGAVAVPLSMLFGPDALEYRLNDSAAVAAIVDAAALPGLMSVRGQCPALRNVIVAAHDGESAADAASAFPQGVQLWQKVLPRVKAGFSAADTLADDAAVLIYTSGTTGPPKGALIAHRALIGNLTGFVASQNWLGFDAYPHGTPASIPSPGGGRVREGASGLGAKPSLPGPESQSVFWSPADWAWTGGLMDALLPMLYFGRPIVAYNGRFDPQTALELMRDCGVTHTFLFPTALKAMMKATTMAGGGTPRQSVRQRFKLKLQAIMSAGEAVGDAVFDYCVQQLGVRPNEMFGQTEINYIVGNCDMAPTLPASRGSLPPKGANFSRGGPSKNSPAFVGWPSKPGSMGRPYPGHQVQVIDEAGRECAVGEPGDVAVNRFDIHGDPDPVFFLGYWNNQAATRAKYTGDWCRTGDIAVRDADGYLWYQGRGDDMFKAAGYRIGPGEVENCLVKHPAVANAAVVPKPDAERGAVVKAYVVLAPDFVAGRADSASTHGRFDEAKARQFDQNLIGELQQHVKGKLAPYEYPKEIEFVDALPMTTTGKVQRRVLRLQEAERARERVGQGT